MPKNFAQIYHLFWRKLLRSQRTFLDLPFFRRKVDIRTFAQKYRFILAKAFEVPRNFSRKVSCVRVWGGSPNIQCTQKARHCRAFLFFRNMLELRSKPCFKVLFVKSTLKIRKNFRNGLYNFSLFFPL